MKKYGLTIGLLLSLLSGDYLSSQTLYFDSEFDKYVRDTLREWEHPGAVISVVKDGDHIFVKGYGTSRFGQKRIPNEDTLVTVASVTKAFTATALAILVDEGKLAWDSPIKGFIPEYRFSNQYVTENTTVRDLLTHRAGLPSDMLGGLNNPDYTIQDLLKDLGKSTPMTGFRERLNYGNINYALAGEVVSRVSGMSWDKFIAQRILKPLGMTSTYATPSQLKESLGDPNYLENIFIRAIQKEGRIVSDEWFGYDYLYAPAASIVTTARDIAKWMIAQLQNGEYRGERIFSDAVAREMRNPLVVEDVNWARLENSWWKDARNHFSPLIGCGLGWWSYDYQGRRVDEHWGAGAGCSVLALIVEEDLAVFVTTNADYPNWVGNWMVDALKLKILDLVLELPDTDWSTKFLAAKAGSKVD